MTITLAVGATALALPPDLYWSDEYAWAPVEQTTQRTVTGALIVSAATRVAGRPITLQADESSAWTSRADVEQLRNWAASPGQVLTLTLRGVPRDVIFRHHDGVAVDAAPIIQFNVPDDADWYRLTLRLMEI